MTMAIETRTVKLVRLREGVDVLGRKVDENGLPRRLSHLVNVEASLGSSDGVTACCGVAFAPGTLVEVPWIESLPHGLCLRRSPWPRWKVEADYRAANVTPGVIDELPGDLKREDQEILDTTPEVATSIAEVEMTKHGDGIPVAHMVTAKAVGIEVRRLREARGWTREQFVARLDSPVGARTMLSYEHGIRQLTLGRFVDICAALGVAPAAVMSSALRTKPRDLETSVILVSLRDLVQTTEPQLATLRRWATNKLDNHSPAFVELRPTVVGELAALVGCSHVNLARYLAGAGGKIAWPDQEREREETTIRTRD